MRKRILLSAISPIAFLAGMPALPISQRTWMTMICGKLSEGLDG